MDRLISLKVKRGTAWVLLERVLFRAITFVRVPVLAYLLSPHDFGLMGIISTILLFIDVVTRTGFDAALIQKQGNVDDFFDVGWTLAVIKGGLQTLALLILTKPIALFYNEPTLEPLFLMIALATLVGGINSIRIVQLTRDLEIGKLTKYSLGVEFATLIFTLGMAYWLRNVWALASAVLAKAIFELIGSYIIAPYRPKFDLDISKAKELWSFGKWMLLSGVFLTLFMHGDDLFVGKVLGVVALGYYSMAYKIGNMVTTELVDAFRKIFFPAFSSMQNDLSRLKRAFLSTYHLTAAIGAIFAVSLFWLAPEFVSVLLDDRWLPIIPALRVLAIWGGFQMLSTSTAPLFRAVGRPDWWAKVQGIKLLLLIILIYPLSVRFDITGTAIAVLISSVFEVPFGLWWTKQALNCKWSEILMPLTLPLAGILVASSAYLIFNNLWEMQEILHLFLFGVLIFIFYGLVVLGIDYYLKAGFWSVVKRAVIMWS